MPSEIYEVVAQGARYWFVFLMALIVWRSYRWYRRDRKQRKKRLRLLPDAGYVGEMVILSGGGELERGSRPARTARGDAWFFAHQRPVRAGARRGQKASLVSL